MTPSDGRSEGKKEVEEKIRKELEKANDYYQTILTCQAFGNIIVYDFKGKVFISNKFVTSVNNEVAQQREVTPDIVGCSPDFVVVGEIKKSLPREQQYWFDVLQQLKKYDDNLNAKSNNFNTGDHDIVLIIHHTLSRAFKKFFENQKNFIFKRNFVIVEFGFSPNLEEKIFLRTEYGTFKNKKLQSMLENGLPIPVNRVVDELSQLKFIDNEPPVVYTMEVIWLHALGPRSPLKRYRVGGQKFEIEVSVDDLHSTLNRFFAPKGTDLPRRAWIRSALDKFTEIGLAVRKTANTYTIKYGRLPTKGREIKEFLLWKLFEKERKIESRSSFKGQKRINDFY